MKISEKKTVFKKLSQYFDRKEKTNEISLCQSNIINPKLLSHTRKKNNILLSLFLIPAHIHVNRPSKDSYEPRQEIVFDPI